MSLKCGSLPSGRRAELTQIGATITRLRPHLLRSQQAASATWRRASERSGQVGRRHARRWRNKQPAERGCNLARRARLLCRSYCACLASRSSIRQSQPSWPHRKSRKLSPVASRRKCSQEASWPQLIQLELARQDNLINTPAPRFQLANHPAQLATDLVADKAQPQERHSSHNFHRAPAINAIGHHGRYRPRQRLCLHQIWSPARRPLCK